MAEGHCVSASVKSAVWLKHGNLFQNFNLFLNQSYSAVAGANTNNLRVLGKPSMANRQHNARSKGGAQGEVRFPQCKKSRVLAHRPILCAHP